MLNRAKQSVLAPAVIEWKHIRGGVDLATFSPGSREEARSRLDLDLDTKVLLYVANQGSENPYKDFETVLLALHELHHQRPPRKIILLVVGSTRPDQEIGPNILIRHVGYIGSQACLAVYYRAANILVHSAIEETFGNVVAEALACGTPVIAASGGGVVELLDHGCTGLIVPPRQPAQLAEALAQLLDAPALCDRMGLAAAAVRCHLDSRAMIRNLHSWCTHVHSVWHAQAER